MPLRRYNYIGIIHSINAGMIGIIEELRFIKSPQITLKESAQ